jgi:tetratricopeptide (TPR) repeat protein
MVAESHLAAGEYQTALSLIGSYTKQYPEWTGQFAPVFSGLQAVALYGIGKKDEARLYLDNLLGQKNLRADNLVAVTNRLNALGAHDLALSALTRAAEADPLNQAALASLLRLEIATGSLSNLPVQLERYLHTRKPSREILGQAYATIGSDRHLFLPGQGELLASRRP